MLCLMLRIFTTYMIFVSKQKNFKRVVYDCRQLFFLLKHFIQVYQVFRRSVPSKRIKKEIAQISNNLNGLFFFRVQNVLVLLNVQRKIPIKEPNPYTVHQYNSDQSSSVALFIAEIAAQIPPTLIILTIFFFILIPPKNCSLA